MYGVPYVKKRIETFRRTGSDPPELLSLCAFMLSKLRIITLLLCSHIVLGCTATTDSPSVSPFMRLDSSATGITFQNTIQENEGFNVLEYEYFFNGGGVAAGDINNDGLPDLYFTSNMGQDELYLNKGDLTFEPITETAGLLHEPGWHTGVTMADVNGDGWLDIYVARSGQVSTDRRRNLLYINNGNLTFTEQAREFGINDPSYSNHASFFDYDRDGDLDMFLLNHPIKRYAFFVVDFMKSQRDSLAGDKLYRNDNGKFVDVSASAGIIGNPLGFGLSATVSDINQDGWPDIYVANDYIEEDYLYLNQQDGSFKESSKEWITVASYSSMGADIADINNDGLVDLITLDMLADNHERQKILKGPENFTYYEQMRNQGYHDQAMRNMLHVRTTSNSFTEIGRMAGVAYTDWSWAPLFADFDNDGYKDLLITNGYLRDYTNLDFLEDILYQAREASALGKTFSSMEMVRQMPSTKIPNYIYRNSGNLLFENKQETWEFEEPTFSNGAAYSDLDRDGDLDLVINNINQEAFIYENNSSQNSDHRYLRISFDGPSNNVFGVGSSVRIKTSQGIQVIENTPSRGYLSGVEPVLHVGLGSHETVHISVTWPDGNTQEIQQQPTNTELVFRYQDASPHQATDPATTRLFSELDATQTLPFTHQENAFVDFEREPLLPHMLSRLGPAFAQADVNRDGLADVYLGGARSQKSSLYLQQLDGSFLEASVPDFEAHAEFEDVDAVFFDADNDGDPDLYVVSGGNDVEDGHPIYQDRLYVNNGFGGFVFSASSLPEMATSTGTIAPFDYDLDGDIDLFVGGRTMPGMYPTAPRSYLLENNQGEFLDVTASIAPDLVSPGMITDAAWGALSGTGYVELVLAGEWMPLRVFRYKAGVGFTEATNTTGLASHAGWWNTLSLNDLDGDGDLDILAGNKGSNSGLHASPEAPVVLYASDIDANGRIDAVITHDLQGKRHTIYWRNEIVQQIPRWQAVFPDQTSYARATFDDLMALIPPDAMEYTANDFETRLFKNDGSGTFSPVELPIEAQIAPVKDFLVHDFDGDGYQDILLAGNNFASRAEWGRDNAGEGLMLRGQSGLQFEAIPPSTFGVSLNGDVRNLAQLQGDRRIFIIQNNGPLRLISSTAPLQLP